MCNVDILKFTILSFSLSAKNQLVLSHKGIENTSMENLLFFNAVSHSQYLGGE